MIQYGGHKQRNQYKPVPLPVTVQQHGAQHQCRRCDHKAHAPNDLGIYEAQERKKGEADNERAQNGFTQTDTTSLCYLISVTCCCFNRPDSLRKQERGQHQHTQGHKRRKCTDREMLSIRVYKLIRHHEREDRKSKEQSPENNISLPTFCTTHTLRITSVQRLPSQCPERLRRSGQQIACHLNE